MSLSIENKSVKYLFLLTSKVIISNAPALVATPSAVPHKKWRQHLRATAIVFWFVLLVPRTPPQSDANCKNSAS